MNKYRIAFMLLFGVIAVLGREPNHPSVYEQVSHAFVKDDQNRSDVSFHWVGLTITCLTARCRYI